MIKHGSSAAIMFVDCLNSITQFNDVLGNFNKPIDTNLEWEMMKEELMEYYNASTENNKPEQIDALADLFFVLWGTICKHGWRDQFIQALNAVCEANGSKFCATEAQAHISVEHYKQQGIEASYEYNAEYSVYIIKRFDGKGLKGINFKAPDHSALSLT
jgi:hypothetical protein